MRGSGGLRLLLTLTVLTALTLTLIDLRVGAGSPFDALRRGGDALLGPAQRLLGGGARSAGGALGALPRWSGPEDSRRLQQDNDRLRSELARSADVRRELAEMKALVGLRDSGRYTAVPAYVSTRGSFLGFDDALTIDVGERSGVRKDHTVVNARGLVGRILRVGPTTSTVLLLTDRKFSVGAGVAGQRGVGFVRGDGSAGLTYEQVEGDRVLVDKVLLTGGGTLTRGVPVGTVRLVRPTGTEVSSAVVTPFADVTSLDLLMVITEGPTGGEPRVPVPPASTPAPQRVPEPGVVPQVARPSR